MIASLGGEESLSEQRKTLLDSAMLGRIYLQHLDAWLLQQKSLVRRNRSVVPVLLQRFQISSQLERTLSLLGLDRIAIDASLDLNSYMAQRAKALAEQNPEAPANEPDSQPERTESGK
jgi:hypothetical protein